MRYLRESYAKLTKKDWENFLKITNSTGSLINGALCKDCKHVIQTVSRKRLAAHRYMTSKCYAFNQMVLIFAIN